jgi:hypothetical protein
LRVDPVARDVERRYAAVMRRARSNAHDLDGATPTRRLASAGRRPWRSSEVALVADDFARLVEFLWNSPEYRAEVLSPTATHVGIGVASDRDEGMFVAIDCEQISTLVDARAAAAEIAARLPSLHRSGPSDELFRPTVDAELAAIAREIAIDLAIGWTYDQAMSLVDREVKEAIQSRYAHVRFAVRMVSDAARLDVRGLADGLDVVDNVGIGVAQAARQGPLSGRVYVVAIFAEFR